MNAENADQAFALFNNPFDNACLNLTNLHYIVETMGGKLAIESELDKTKFKFSIKLQVMLNSLAESIND